LIVELDLIVKLNWDELVVLYVEMSGCVGAKCESQVRGREGKKEIYEGEEWTYK
jgi:hypothetical protein